MPSPISDTLRPVHSSAKSRWRSGRSSTARLTAASPGSPLRQPSTHIYSPRRAPVDRYEGGRGDCARRGPRRAARPPPAAPPAAGRDRDGGHRPVRAVPVGPALARARCRCLRTADVGLRRHLQDAPRRSGRARAARARGLPGPVRSRAGPGHDTHAAPAARARRTWSLLRLGEAADLVPLAVVPVPARDRPLPPPPPSRALPPRSDADLRDL